MLTLLSRLSGSAVEPLDLNRDYADVDALLAAEEWPFLRSDLEVSHAQPRAAAFVARRREQFAGFFATHAFGHVGYLDMMIVAPAFRRRGVARPLYLQTIAALERQGIEGWAVHTTNESAPIIERLGFTPGLTYSLLRRAPRTVEAARDDELAWLGSADREVIVAADAAVFGRERGPWITALLRQPQTRFIGRRSGDRLAAALCLRPRRNGAYCLDLVSAADDRDAGALVDAVLRRFDANRLECFVRCGSALEARLLASGFEVPAFFHAIGPLVEWRKGRTGGIGDSERMQCLSWF
jgi:GNAT superfamily N-acetyltransferase